MIGSEDNLMAIDTKCTLWEEGNTGAVDEDVDSWDIGPRHKFGSGGAYGLLARKINVKGPVVDIGVLGLHGVNTLLKL